MNKQDILAKQDAIKAIREEFGWNVSDKVLDEYAKRLDRMIPDRPWDDLIEGGSYALR